MIVMNDLILLLCGDDLHRFSSFEAAQAHAASLRDSGFDGRIKLEITPAGGGLMKTLEYAADDWVAAEQD